MQQTAVEECTNPCACPIVNKEDDLILHTGSLRNVYKIIFAPQCAQDIDQLPFSKEKLFFLLMNDELLPQESMSDPMGDFILIFLLNMRTSEPRKPLEEMLAKRSHGIEGNLFCNVANR